MKGMDRRTFLSKTLGAAAGVAAGAAGITGAEAKQHASLDTNDRAERTPIQKAEEDARFSERMNKLIDKLILDLEKKPDVKPGEYFPADMTELIEAFLDDCALEGREAYRTPAIDCRHLVPVLLRTQSKFPKTFAVTQSVWWIKSDEDVEQSRERRSSRPRPTGVGDGEDA